MNLEIETKQLCARVSVCVLQEDFQHDIHSCPPRKK